MYLRICAAFIGWLSLNAIGSNALGQKSDSFEGGPVRWVLVESDCDASLSEHLLSRTLPRGGQFSEQFAHRAGNGTFSWIAYPIEPCAIIDEFLPSLWIRSASGPMRLGARVVFPKASHAITGGRVTKIIWGETYNQPGKWQKLQLSDAKRKADLEQIAVREQFGAHLNLEGAFIDCLVVDTYTGPGQSLIQIDDLELRGMISLSDLGQPVAVDWRSRWRWRAEVLPAEQVQWAQAISNRPPLYYQYRGESLRWLHSLGFRGLMLDRIPAKSFLDEANSVGLTVICPPPQISVTVDDRPWSIVKGWLVGEALDVQQSTRLISQVERLVGLPEQLKRPLMSEAMENYWMFSRITDEVIVPAPSTLSAGEPVEKLGWLSKAVEVSQKRGTGWVTIALDDPNWKKQLDVAHGVADAGKVALKTTVDPWQVRLQLARALSANAKAFLVRTSQPLEPNSDVDRPRKAALRSINRDLATIGPWIVAGQTVNSVRLNRDDYRAAAWTTSRSHLVLAHTVASGSTHCVPPTAGRPLECRLPIPFGSAQVMRLTSGSMETLPLSPTPEGLTWSVKHPAPIEIFVLTDNTTVNNFLRRQLSLTSMEAAEDNLDIAAHMLDLATQTAQSRWQDNSQEAARNELRMLTSGQRSLEDGMHALRLNQAALSVSHALEASHAAQTVLFSAYRAVLNDFVSPQTTPLALNPNGLRYHWLMAQACARSVWRPLPLAGTDFANLQQMLQSGWSQDRRQQAQVDVVVELVPPQFNAQAAIDSPVSDGSSIKSGSLRLVALNKSTETVAGGYEGASVRVRSSSAPVFKGQLVRVDGVAEIRSLASPFGTGLLVYDNQSGPSFGQLIRGSPGERVNIQLYRFVTEDGDFRVLAELRGACDIVIESLSLSVIEPATNRTEYPTAPYTTPPRTAANANVER